MSLLKRRGWELNGTVFGGTVFFILSVLITILIITQTSKLILELIDIKLAALLVGDIINLILNALGWTVLIILLLIFCVLLILVPLNALINKMINPVGSWNSDTKDGFGGFIIGLGNGVKMVYGFEFDVNDQQ
ncbi:hypothetical protein ACFLR4_02705 [Bacteroidota bacterium]